MLGGAVLGQGSLPCRGEENRLLLEAAAAAAAGIRFMKMRALSLLSRLPASRAVPSLRLLYPLLASLPHTPLPAASITLPAGVSRACVDRLNKLK